MSERGASHHSFSATLAAGAALLLALTCGHVRAEAPAADSALERGEYVLRAAGCLACHTDEEGGGAALAGGRALRTDFGTFYSPNITPDRDNGIGGWSERDLRRALADGLDPRDEHYFPVFPYTAYTGMREEDVRALWAYLQTVEPVARPNRPHELPWYFRYRGVMALWKWLFFEPGRLAHAPDRTPQWNRGAYLAEALAHCGECHTPRGMLGALQPALHYAGSARGPEGEAVPNITPDRETGIGRWSASDLSYFLATGMRPDGDFTGGLMALVVDEGTAHLTEEDRAAIADYVLSLAPINNAVGGESGTRRRSAFD